LRTGSTIILAIVGIWVLTVLSRPVTRVKALVIGAMFIGLVLVFSVPIATEFFQLVDPGEECAWLIAAVTIVTIGGIEIVRFFHRRYVARSLAAASYAVTCTAFAK
jgi:cation-transporting ATPase E